MIEAGFGEGEVLGEIDAEDFVLGFVDADAEAVVEEAELFELLGILAFARGQLGNFAEGGGGEGVEADVFVECFGGGGVAVVRDLAAGEVEGVSFVVADNLRDLGIGGVVGIGDFLFESPQVAVVIGRLEEVADHLFVDEGFIALPIDPNVGVDEVFFEKLDEAFGAVGAAFGGHDRSAAEGLDELRGFLGVDGEDDFVEEGNFARGVPDPFEKGLIVEHGEHFAGEAGRF